MRNKNKIGPLSPPPSIPYEANKAAYGKWQITDTVCSTRKNLFCVDPNSGYHVGTIVSGSRSRLDRFERSLALIRAAPEMLYVLEAVATSIRAGKAFDRAELLSAIESVLEGLDSLSVEG